MKKFALMCLCGLTAAAFLTGCSQSISLGEYKGVEVTVASAEVTEDEVYAEAKKIMDANPAHVEVDCPAKDGVTVNIDYVGTQDGVEFAGGTGTGQDLVLGSNSFIPGFEAGLVGAKKGDVKDLDLTFPDPYTEPALAGQPVTFKVTVNAVKEKQEAVLDDAFVQRVSDFKTVEEFMNDTRADLEKARKQQVESKKEQDVLQIVMDSSSIKLSRSDVAKRYNAEIKNYTAQAQAYGTSLAGMAQNYGTDEGGLKEMIKASVEADMKQQLVIETIAAQENLVVDEADRQAFAELNGADYETLVSYYGEEQVAQQVEKYKVMKFLADNAVEKVEAPAETTAAGETAAETTAGETAAETTAAETTAAETTAAETAAGETTAAAEAAAETTSAQ